MYHLRYCDGTGHQGYAKNPFAYKGKQIYFRGHNIALAQFDSMESLFNVFSNATDILITGQSAGGVAALHWSNEIIKRSSKNTKIRIFSDSSLYIDNILYENGSYIYAAIRDLMRNFMKLSNAEDNVLLP